MAAAEPRRDLDHLRARPGRPEAGCRTGRSRSRAPPRPLRRRLGDLGARHRARPDVRERDAEGGRLGVEPVGDRQRREDAADREADHGHLRPVDELLDERQAVPRGAARGLDRRGQARRVARRASGPSGPAGRAPSRRPGPSTSGSSSLAADDPRARLRDARLGEALALAQLVRREHRRLRRDRVRQPGALGDPRRDADRPVGAGRDDPVDLERADEPLDRGLVLGREDAAAVGEAGSRARAGSRSTTAIQRPRARAASSSPS